MKKTLEKYFLVLEKKELMEIVFFMKLVMVNMKKKIRIMIMILVIVIF